jgi:hypothetical protein
VKPKEARGSFVDVVEEEYIKKAITYEIVKEAYLLSINSNIHIYDYLVVLPFKGGGEVVYSSDPHFQHSDFTSIAKVINPLENWIITSNVAITHSADKKDFLFLPKISNHKFQ